MHVKALHVSLPLLYQEGPQLKTVAFVVNAPAAQSYSSDMTLGSRCEKSKQSAVSNTPMQILDIETPLLCNIKAH